MSRSRKYHPYVKIAGESDKKDKRLANRKFRKAVKAAISIGKTPPTKLREVSDNWEFSSDGLTCYLTYVNSTKEEDQKRVKYLIRK